MIVVSPTVFTSAKYDSEEGLSFVNCCYIRLAQKTLTIDGVREFKQLFDKYNVQYMYYEMPGDHEAAVWQHGLYNFARRIFR